MKFSSLKLPLILMLVFSVLLLAGCKEENDNSNSKSTLDTVIDKGTLRVAMIPDNPPWSVVNSDSEFEGYDVEIAKRLGEALGVEVEFVSTSGANRLPNIQSNKVDVVISAFTSTNERAKSLNFTVPYAAAGPLPLFKKSNSIESWEDLKGKKVSVARGSTNDSVMTKYFPDTEVVKFEAISDAFQALKTGKVDALIEENPLVYEFAKNNSDLEALDAEPYKLGLIAMAVEQGDSDWLNYLNTFIRNINVSGENAELYKEWFGKEIPKLYNY